MQPTNRRAKDSVKHFLGRHTALSIIKATPKLWRSIPYLRENDGHAPPVLLAVGDRRRVYTIARLLQAPVFLPETAENLAHLRQRHENSFSTGLGRVAMAVGSIASIPVLVVETQMGSPATQIILHEVLSDQLTSKEYKIGRKRFNLSHKIVIRVGTAGGINCKDMPIIRVGDVVNATHSIGATGAILQSLSGLDFWHPEVYSAFCSKWRNLGPDFTITSGGHPRAKCSRDVVDAIEAAAKRLTKGVYHKGGNVTKDSLYAELSEDMFLDLCRTENCRTTEMELSSIAVAAKQHNASFGMVSAIVGVLPGSSFAENAKKRKVAEDIAVRVGLGALAYLS